jgi:glycosyltransferase involved in cell wall biosynthesis
MQKVPVTIILPVHNEEKNIRGCLSTVLFADQILVVDGASTDHTRRIAAEYPITIIDAANDFAEPQRLKALAFARHPWVFFIDADERVTEALASSIADAVAHNSKSAAAYRVCRRNLYRNRPLHVNNPDWQLRLFLKDRTEFPDKIHREPVIRGSVERIEGDLLHYFFTTTQDYLKRLLGYTRIEASYAGGASARKSFLRTTVVLWIRPVWRFVQYYFLRKGFLDGYFGFFYSVSSAHYEWVVASRMLIDPSPEHSADGEPATRKP